MKSLYTFSKYRKPNQPWVKRDSRFYQLRNTMSLYNFGLYLTIFGLCYGTIPIYRIFCEHVGLEGDLKQKDYSMEGKTSKQSKIVIPHRKFKLIFKADSDPDMDWDFDPVNEEMYVNAGETALTFYKAFNKEKKPIVGFATYQVFPIDALLYFSKIQCFCFNQQMLNTREEIFLPIYFYLEPEILENQVLETTKEITIIYKFYRAKDQNLALMAQEEQDRIEKNQQILQKIRAEKAQEKQVNTVN